MDAKSCEFQNITHELILNQVSRMEDIKKAEENKPSVLQTFAECNFDFSMTTFGSQTIDNFIQQFKESVYVANDSDLEIEEFDVFMSIGKGSQCYVCMNNNIGEKKGANISKYNMQLIQEWIEDNSYLYDLENFSKVENLYLENSNRHPINIGVTLKYFYISFSEQGFTVTIPKPAAILFLRWIDAHYE
jgi:hypothetical protein